MPAKERLWRDEEGAPAPSRQQPGEGGEAPDPQGDKRRAIDWRSRISTWWRSTMISMSLSVSVCREDRSRPR